MINFFAIVVSGFLLHTTHLWCVLSVQKKKTLYVVAKDSLSAN